MTPVVYQTIAFLLFFVGLIVAAFVLTKREQAAERENHIGSLTKRPSESYTNPPRPEAKP